MTRIGWIAKLLLPELTKIMYTEVSASLSRCCFFSNWTSFRVNVDDHKASGSMQIDSDEGIENFWITSLIVKNWKRQWNFGA